MPYYPKIGKGSGWILVKETHTEKHGDHGGDINLEFLPCPPYLRVLRVGLFKEGLFSLR